MRNFLSFVLIAASLIVPAPAFAALSANTVWEVRASASDTNGGGFVAGASGTDWSLQDSPQYSVTDAVTAGSTTVTSATAAFGTDIVGNICYITGGTGSITAGRYEVTGRTNSTTITVDRSTGLTAGTGVTLRCGGALATVNTAASSYVSNNRIFVRGGTEYTTATEITFANAVRIFGYTTARGDRGRFTLRATASPSGYVVKLTNGDAVLENAVIDCDERTTCSGVHLQGGGSSVFNAIVKDFTVRGIFAQANFSAIRAVEVTGGVAGCTTGISITDFTGGNYITDSYIHDNACTGVISSNATFVGNIVANNTGVSSDGVFENFNGLYMFNTFYGNGRDAIRLAGSYPRAVVLNNIFMNNTGYGLNAVNAQQGSRRVDGNAFFGNTAGTINNLSASTGINAPGAYTYTRNITTTYDPFVNAAGGNFELNGTGGGGAALKGTGYGAQWPTLSTTTSAPDFGAAASAGAAGGSGGSFVFGQ